MNMATVGVNVSDDAIRSLLCSAFEGGSNYWYMIERYDLPAGHTLADYKPGGRFYTAKDYWHTSQIIPLCDGCAVIISDNSGESDKPAGTEYRLDRAAIDRGCAVMASKYPQHFADLISENDDATTGDVFIQCCLFGEVVYS